MSPRKPQDLPRSAPGHPRALQVSSKTTPKAGNTTKTDVFSMFLKAPMAPTEAAKGVPGGVLGVPRGSLGSFEDT